MQRLRLLRRRSPSIIWRTVNDTVVSELKDHIGTHIICHSIKSMFWRDLDYGLVTPIL